MIDMYGDKVRVRKEGNPFEVTYDITVEVLREGVWYHYAGFNSVSNDYAYTNATTAALRARDTV